MTDVTDFVEEGAAGNRKKPSGQPSEQRRSERVRRGGRKLESAEQEAVAEASSSANLSSSPSPGSPMQFTLSPGRGNKFKISMSPSQLAGPSPPDPAPLPIQRKRIPGNTRARHRASPGKRAGSANSQELKPSTAAALSEPTQFVKTSGRPQPSTNHRRRRRPTSQNSNSSDNDSVKSTTSTKGMSRAERAKQREAAQAKEEEKRAEQERAKIYQQQAVSLVTFTATMQKVIDTQARFWKCLWQHASPAVRAQLEQAQTMETDLRNLKNRVKQDGDGDGGSKRENASPTSPWQTANPLKTNSLTVSPEHVRRMLFSGGTDCAGQNRSSQEASCQRSIKLEDF